MQYNTIQGSTGFEDVYDNAIAACTDGARFVEIGVSNGRSACYMAERIRDSGKHIIFYAIDPFDNDRHFEECRDNLARAELLTYVHLRRERSLEVAGSLPNGLDYVFIDSAHSEDSVWQDIHAWYPKIRPGGCLAVNGDTDKQNAPGAHSAIDRFAAESCLTLEQSGTYCVTRKPLDDNMQFGIAIATYRRPDGSSEHKLARALRSILAQTYRNWKVYLVGDRYDNESEFQSLSSIISQDQRYSINLSHAAERDSGIRGQELWHCGGSHALNTALDQQSADGIAVTCHLDDDDAWHPDHLRILAEAYRDYPAAAFVYTQADNTGTPFPSDSQVAVHLNNRPPAPCGLTHSAASWRLSHINLRYSGRVDRPGDADLWARMRQLCVQRGYHTLYVPRMTAFHFSDQSTLTYYPDS